MIAADTCCLQGLDVAMDNPEEAMTAMRYMLRGSEGADPAPRAVRRSREEHSTLASRARAADGASADDTPAPPTRHPVRATPGSVLFLLRVIACMRGMATTLSVPHSYLEEMRPYAAKALRAALCPDPNEEAHPRQHQRNDVCVAPVPSGRLQEHLMALLAQLTAEGTCLGLSVSVYHEGSLLANAWAGELGTLDPRPVRADSLYSSFSCGKAVLSLLLHVLIHRGLLRLEERVSALWPAFGAHGKQHITVRQVLEHCSGLASYVPHGATVRTLLDYDAMVDGLEAAAPTSDIGRPTYHALSFGWLVGGVAQRAVARHSGGAMPTFGAVLDEHIVRPLRLEGQLFAGLPPEGSKVAVRYAVYDRLACCTIERPAAAAADLFDEIAGSHGSGGDCGGVEPRPRLIVTGLRSSECALRVTDSHRRQEEAAWASTLESSTTRACDAQTSPRPTCTSARTRSLQCTPRSLAAPPCRRCYRQPTSSASRTACAQRCAAAGHSASVPTAARQANAASASTGCGIALACACGSEAASLSPSS